MLYLHSKYNLQFNDILKIKQITMIVPSHPFPPTGYPVYTDPTVQGNLRWDDSRYPGVDILLTSDWPKGISNRTQASEVRDLGMEQNLIFSKGNECLPSGVHRGGGQ